MMHNFFILIVYSTEHQGRGMGEFDDHCNFNKEITEKSEIDPKFSVKYYYLHTRYDEKKF
jgi:hypothetical protein